MSYGINSEELAEYYSDFKVSERILLTGHSHQAWPNIAKKGLIQSWQDAAELADLKWGRAFEKADRVRAGFKMLMNDDDGLIALASNTHELIIKFLSALDLKNRSKIITTDMEFHTVRRQLDRLGEENIEIVRISSSPIEDIADRIIKEIDDKTSCVILSKCFYKNGRIVKNLGTIEKECLRMGALLLVDLYHVMNVLEFDIKIEGLTNSFLVGGGYKYCQLGEGNCFLRIPHDIRLRPIITGWFSEFNKLAETKKAVEVPYGEGHYRFAGSTYDPVSNYRAAEVFDFFAENELTVGKLREKNLSQIKLLAKLFDAYDFNPNIIRKENNDDLSLSGGFFVLITEYSSQINRELFKRNIFSDFRENHLRFGPAPYVTGEQLTFAMSELNEIIKIIGK